MDIQALVNPQTLAFVVLGTLLGTLLKCGPANVRQAAAALWKAAGPRFDAAQTRALLAYHAERICKDGVLRASDRSCSDADIDECLKVLVRQRSIRAMETAARAKHQAREARRVAAIQTLESAAELAPVFGLAGTLLALSQLPSGGIGAEGLMPTVAMAVQTTLFGLALAHIVLVPLAQWIDRIAMQELTARKELLGWFLVQIDQAIPRSARAGNSLPADIAELEAGTRPEANGTLAAKAGPQPCDKTVRASGDMAA